ncbi:hypothetical protein Avbf_15990, partial [Armadillidium vulgare]
NDTHPKAEESSGILETEKQYLYFNKLFYFKFEIVLNNILIENIISIDVIFKYFYFDKNFNSFNLGGETTCTDLSKTLSSIVKALFHINISKHEYAISNIEKCWKDLPETMLGHTYFLTPKLNQEAAAKYCKDHGGKPFIPKTENEFLYYVAMTVEPETDKYSWYPVNDIKEEGHAVLLDGTGGITYS